MVPVAPLVVAGVPPVARPVPLVPVLVRVVRPHADRLDPLVLREPPQVLADAHTNGNLNFVCKTAPGSEPFFFEVGFRILKLPSYELL